MSDAMMESPRSLERTVQDALGESWQAFKQDFVLYVVANLILTVVSVVTLGLLFPALTVGFIDIVRKRRRGEAAGIGDIFGGLSRFGTSLVAGILVLVGVCVGLVLLVLPGLIFFFLASFTFQNIAYRHTGAVDAIKDSIGLVRAHLMVVVAVMAVILVISMIGGSIWIGSLVTSPFCMIMATIAYEKLSGNA